MNITQSIREGIRIRREASVARSDMRRLLSVYTTPAEIDDMLAAADRFEGPEAELMREILAENLQAYWRRDHQRFALGAHVAA